VAEQSGSSRNTGNSHGRQLVCDEAAKTALFGVIKMVSNNKSGTSERSMVVL
jgi:hypothetical protein